MAIDHYHDRCELLNFSDEEDVKKCGSMVANIWKEYLSRNSPNEVSLPSDDRQVTIDRMDKITKFKGKLFDVAIQDAMKTLQKDTLHRFIKSSQFAELISRLSETPDAFEEYTLTLPCTMYITMDNYNENFTLDDIVKDKCLCQDFFTFLEKKFNSENLKCVLEIQLFEQLAKVQSKDIELQTKQKAWSIFRNFIMPAAPYEVSCTNAVRKNIMQSLGCPNPTMFDEIKDITMMTLKQDHSFFLSCLDRNRLRVYIQDMDKKAAKLKTNRRTASLKAFFTRK